MVSKVENILRQMGREKMASDEQKKQQELELNELQAKVIDRKATATGVKVDLDKVLARVTSSSGSHYINQSNFLLLKQHYEVLKQMTNLDLNQLLKRSNELRIRVQFARESTRKRVEEKISLREKKFDSNKNMKENYKSKAVQVDKKLAYYQNKFNEKSSTLERKIVDEQEIYNDGLIEQKLIQSEKELELQFYAQVQQCEKEEFEIIKEKEQRIQDRNNEILEDKSQLHVFEDSLEEMEKNVSVAENDLGNHLETEVAKKESLLRISPLLSEKTKSAERSKEETENTVNRLKEFLNKKTVLIQKLQNFNDAEKEFAANRLSNFQNENNSIEKQLELEKSSHLALLEMRKNEDSELLSKKYEFLKLEESFNEQMNEKEVIKDKQNQLQVEILDSEIAASRARKHSWTLESSKEETAHEISEFQNKIGNLTQSIEMLDEKLKTLTDKEANLSLKIQTLDETLLMKEEEHTSMNSNLDGLVRKFNDASAESEKANKTHSALLMESSDIKYEVNCIQADIQKEEASMKYIENERASITKWIDDHKAKNELAIQELSDSIQKETENYQKEMEFNGQTIATKIKNEAELLHQIEKEKKTIESEKILSTEAETSFEAERISMERKNDEQKRLLADEYKNEEMEKRNLEEKLKRLNEKQKSLQRLQKNLGYNQRVVINCQSSSAEKSTVLRHVEIGTQGISLIVNGKSTSTVEELKSAQKGSPQKSQQNGLEKTTKEAQVTTLAREGETEKLALNKSQESAKKAKTVTFDSSTKFHTKTTRPTKITARGKKRESGERPKDVQSKKKALTNGEKRDDEPKIPEKDSSTAAEIPDFLKDSPITKKTPFPMTSTPIKQDNIAATQLRFYQNRAIISRKPM